VSTRSIDGGHLDRLFFWRRRSCFFTSSFRFFQCFLLNCSSSLFA